MSLLSERGGTRAWRRVRQAVLADADQQCTIAGLLCTGTATEVDHVVPRVRGGSDELHNLRAVCSQCHAEKSRIETADRRRRSTWERPAEPHPGLVNTKLSTVPRRC